MSQSEGDMTGENPDESTRKNSSAEKIAVREKRILRKSVENTIIHLPPIETYTKEVIFTAEGPGRVVAKIERLMGSDKINYFDREWMAEFARVLDIDDARDLVEKSKMRADNERERSKKLALNMKMVPSAENEMEEIKSHPLYKVNAIMKKLENMNVSARLTSKTKLPPIVPIEPFEEDLSGKIFLNFPGHRKYDGGTEAKLLYKNAEIIPSATDTYFESEMEAETTPSDTENDDEEEEGDEEAKEADSAEDVRLDWGEAEGDYDGYYGAAKAQVSALDMKVQQSLLDLMKNYNIETQDNIFALYSPYRADLVDDLFASAENVDELYEMGNNINEMYVREARKAEKELKALYRTVAHSTD